MQFDHGIRRLHEPGGTEWGGISVARGRIWDELNARKKVSEVASGTP